MPFQHPEEIGYGHVIERYAATEGLWPRALPRPEKSQPAALGALLRLDAQLGTHHADRFTQPDGLWDQWVNALAHLRGDPSYTPVEFRRRMDLRCDFANGWTHPRG